VTPERRAVIDGIADRVVAMRDDAPLLVGIQGRSAAGKSTLADELAKALAARGVETFASSLDDFHTPGHAHRSRQRLYTPETRYTESYTYDAFRRGVIDLLRERGDRRVRAALWNSGTDEPIEVPWIECPDRVVAIIEGAFLSHPLIADAWDLSIWLDVDFATVLARAEHRDVAWVGSVEDVRRHYREQWIPAHELYEDRTHAIDRCDIVIDQRDVERPRIVRTERPDETPPSLEIQTEPPRNSQLASSAGTPSRMRRS
jgi:uridine kinase